MSDIGLALRNIIEAKKDGNLAIFVGAGVSKTSDSESVKLPLWNDLINDLTSDLGIEEKDFLKLAQMYYLEFGPYTYIKKLEQYFPKGISPSKIHKLIFEINPNVIITTNWDNILENTMEENGFLYDLIRSDSELTKSVLQHKLIKMHGDFDCDNIVFKEDDYLNYQTNFPLIENFIRSILSTHTVVFVGYSYSDFNLKQILNWIQSHSNNRPPMYLVDIFPGGRREKYLANHGIKYLNIAEDLEEPQFEKDYKPNLESFLKQIDNEVSNSDTDEQVLEYVYNRLKIFRSFEYILLDQVKMALGECTFTYDADSTPILKFYSWEITRNMNRVSRGIYRRFVEYLVKIDTKEVKTPEKLREIFTLLSRSGLKGIVLTMDIKHRGREEYLPFGEYIVMHNDHSFKKYLDFNYSLTGQGNNLVPLTDNVFSLFQADRIIEAFRLSEEIVSDAIKSKDYAALLVAMYNYNMLRYLLSYSVRRNMDRNIKVKEKETYDIKRTFFNLPQKLRDPLTAVYELVDETIFVRMAYRISQDLQKTQESKNLIERGGEVYNSDITQYEAQHKNLIQFILSNRIIIENLQTFKSINRCFIQIAIYRQIQKETTTLNKNELFACIKYLDRKDLENILMDLYHKDSGRWATFRIEGVERDWLQNIVLPNLVAEYLKSKVFANIFLDNLLNIFHLFSIAKNSDEQFKEIVALMTKVISEGNNPISLFTSVNIFLGVQYNLFKITISQIQLELLIDTIISKLVLKNYNHQEYRAISSNEMDSLYWTAEKGSCKYGKTENIEQLITALDSFQLTEIIEISENLLIPLYTISIEEIKNRIKLFLLNIQLSDELSDYILITFSLNLAIYDIKDLEDSVAQKIQSYLDKQEERPVSLFGSPLPYLRNAIKYIVENKGNYPSQLNGILEKLEIIIKNGEMRKGLSVF